MLLFKHVQEKDVFERYYKQHLAKRLLLNKSGSNDAEKYMISKLKDECGSIYTKKLEGMFADIDGDVEISVAVLTAVHWPTSSHISPCKLPDGLGETFAHYQAFYVGKHNGRKIELYPILGSADVQAAFYNNLDNGSVKADVKILNVTVYTMVVLMCFNDNPVLKFSELLGDTNIQEKELERCLQSLAMGKATQRILCRKGSGKVIELSDEFSVNDKFSSKLRRIKVQPVSIRESEPEVVETRQKIDEERKHEIEASIVRVMKSRKELNHNDLFTEVVNQLKSRFSPDPLLFKKRIESLIEREYLNRHNDSNRIYTYIA
uniref:Cullin family profile domain-containing protein n=1 Tax=Ditylenchus dipsaci TaxID=166011 RepID=A0A915E2H3_9BILA